MNMERKWLVYCHTHKETGKKYFGITSKSAKERWGKNGYGYQSSPYFYNAIQKYGWDSFYHIVLHEGISERCAKEYEIKYISEYKTNNKKYGFNSTAGGDGTVGIKFSDEARIKRGTDKSVVQLNMNGEYLNTYKNLHEAARQTNCNYSHISSCCNCRYKRQSHKGYLWMFESDYKSWDNTLESYYNRFETEKIKHPKNKKIKAKNIKLSKPVILYSDNGIPLQTFNSISEAQHILNIPYSSIRNSCLTKEKTKNGYNFRFLNDNFDCIKEKDKNKMQRAGIAVSQYNQFGKFIKSYNKIKDVELDGFSKSVVGLCCMNKQSLHKGFIWQRYNNSNEDLPKEIVNDILSISENKKKNNKSFKKVNQYSLDGKYIGTYTSIANAERAVNAKGISDCCSGTVKTLAGYIWYYTDDVTDNSDLSKEQLNEHKQYNHKLVNQYDLDGNYIATYNSIRDATESCGRDRKSACIWAVLNNRQNTAYGYKWKYAD